MTTTEGLSPATDNAPVVHDVHWEIDYKVKLGRAWSRFMRGLADRELWGTTCDGCQRTHIPAQDYCEACYEQVTTWTKVEPVGTVRAATIVYQGFEGGPEAPYAVGAIEIDGTASQLMHFIGGVDLDPSANPRDVLRNGVRVRAKWAEERTASIRDIEHFEIVQD